MTSPSVTRQARRALRAPGATSRSPAARGHPQAARDQGLRHPPARHSSSAAMRSTRACTPAARSPQRFRSSRCTTAASSMSTSPIRRGAGQDLFVLSKGHAVAALASIYAELGYFDRSVLRNSRSFTSILNGHPGPVLPGIQIATGPMGQGLAVAQGFAIAGRVSPRFDCVRAVRRRRDAGRPDLGSGDVRRAEAPGQPVRDGRPQQRPARHGQPDDLPDAAISRRCSSRSTGKCTASTPLSTTASTLRSSSSGSGRATASRRRSSATARRATARFPTF